MSVKSPAARLSVVSPPLDALGNRLTTTRPVGQKLPPVSPPPADAQMPTHWADNFSGYPVGSEAGLWAQTSGSFEVVALPGGNQVLKQAAVGQPVPWLRGNPLPVTQLGDTRNWGEANLTIRLGLPAMPAASPNATAAAVFAGVRVKIAATDGSGVWVAVAGNGEWWLTAGKASQIGAAAAGGGSARIAWGRLSPPPRPGADGVAWTRVELSAAGTAASLRLNGKQVAGRVKIPAGGGNVAVGATLFGPVFFDDFTVAAARNAGPAPPPAPRPGPAPPPLPTPLKCAAPAVGQRVGLWGCSVNNKRGQEWAHSTTGQLELAGSAGKLCIVLATTGKKCSGKCLGLGDCASAPGWTAAGGGGGLPGTLKMKSNPTQCLDVDAKAEPAGVPHSLEMYKW